MRRREALQTGLGVAVAAALRPSSLGAAPPTPLSAPGVDLIPAHADAAAQFAKGFNRAHLRLPRWRALCETPQGAARALLWARENNLPFVVRAGGHCFAGASQSDMLVIDLRRMRSGQIDADKRLARIEAGALTRDAIAALSPLGLAIPAGYCQTVGLGGQVLGGGMGYAVRRFGLLSDHLLGAEMVDAEGRLIRVDAERAPDLHWALRGGGGGFGLVTRLDFRLSPIGGAHYLKLAWSPAIERAGDLLARWTELMASAPREISSIAYFRSRRGGRALVEIVSVCLGGPQPLATHERRLIAEAAPDAPPQRLSGDWAAISRKLWPPDLDGAGRYAFRSGFADAGFDRAAWTTLLEALQAAPRGVSGFCQALGGAASDPAPKDSAYPHRTALSFQFAALLPAEAEAARGVRAGLGAAHEKIAPHLTGGAYLNYRDVDLKNWASAYWGANLPRLRAVKRAVDPGRVFGGPQTAPL